MQWERFRALNDTSEARLSGISVKRLEDRSNDCKVLASGERLLAATEVSPLSARLRCRRNLHFDMGRMPNPSRLEELPRGVFVRALEAELPEERRSLGVPVLEWP